jgi:predicted RNA binding protein YcfA (HicA-like mRNA interferase family)
MPRLRRLSGADVIAILNRFGFAVLRRILPDGASQTLTVPAHGELDTGTCHAIFRQASRFIADEELRAHFYSD